MSPVALTFMTSLLLPIVAFAQEMPIVGILVNQDQQDSLTYECKLVDKSKLQCDFIQVSIRHRAKEADLKSTLNNAKTEFDKGQAGFDAESCQGFQKALDIVTGKIPPIDSAQAKKMASAPARQTQDLIAMLDAITAYCKEKSEATFLRFIKVKHDRDSRTCLVASRPYTQTFQHIPASNTWVTEASATGPCGIVQLSRFELDSTGVAKLWKYVARKAVTNPSGKDPFVGSCSNYDQAEVVYDWRTSDMYAGCDYIEHSPL